MIFARIKRDWYIINSDNNRLYNFAGGWMDYSSNEKNIEETAIATNWLDFFDISGYCPFELFDLEGDMWIAPDGRMFKGEAHTLWADKIYDFFYRYINKYDLSFNAEDFLIKQGWIKVTTSLMLDYYIIDGMYSNMTNSQQEIMSKWTDKYNTSIYIKN